MSKENVHVIPHGENWGVKVEGNERVSRIFATQQDAITYGRNKAIDNASELLIHGRNGQIREKNSYGNDPQNVKG